MQQAENPKATTTIVPPMREIGSMTATIHSWLEITRFVAKLARTPIATPIRISDDVANE
jgi:hypothetical protein